jgi:exopolyphosphatase/guanosine-5'-triphosphate,3'-diphosphate pyrophosphatase
MPARPRHKPVTFPRFPSAPTDRASGLPIHNRLNACYQYPVRRAVIDIGTNTVKLLVADVRDGDVSPIVSKDITTRLGEGVEQTRRLSRVAIARTTRAVADYVADAREHGAVQITALTTAAAREAHNRQDLLDAVRARTGLEVEIITGQREAELIFRGVSSDPAFASGRLLVMDVGGGSAEAIQGNAGRVEQWKSLPLGAVRLTEKFADFAALAEYLRTTLRRELTGWAGRLIATGGTNTTLVRVLKGRVDHATFTLDEVRALVMKLNAMTLDERRRVPGLPPERADIIVAGGAVVVFAMETLGAYELTVSARNLRYGVLAETANR